MIFVLCNWLYISLTLASMGIIFSITIKKIIPWEVAELSIDRIIIVGLIALTTLCNFLSLFFSINYKINIGISVFLLIGIFLFYNSFLNIVKTWYMQFIQLHWATKLALGLVILIALVKTIGPSLVDDEGGYHLPLIRWIENYRVVPGIANIEDRFGFNPGIYMTNAYFSMTWLFSGGLYDVNSFLFIIFSYSFLSGLNQILRNNFSHTLSALIQTSALFFLFRAYLTTMDADFIYMYGSIYFLILIVKKIDSNSLYTTDFDILILTMLFAFVITNKFVITLLSPIIIWIFYNFYKKQKIIFIACLTSVTLLIVGSWIMRNYFICGYLVYPLFFIDFFDVDWKVPLYLARGQYFYVSEYAKIELARDFNTYVSREVPWEEWLPIWFPLVWVQLIGKTIILGVPFGFVLLLYQIFLKTGKKQESNQYLLYLQITLAIAIVIWFVRIPAIRFGWGIVVVFLVISFGTSFKKYLDKYTRWVRLGTITLVFISLLRSSIASVIENPDFIYHFIYPLPVKPDNIYETLQMNDTTIQIAEDNLCKGILPPCLPRRYHPDLMMRGNKVTDGFYIKK